MGDMADDAFDLAMMVEADGGHVLGAYVPGEVVRVSSRGILFSTKSGKQIVDGGLICETWLIDAKERDGELSRRDWEVYP